MNLVIYSYELSDHYLEILFYEVSPEGCVNDAGEMRLPTAIILASLNDIFNVLIRDFRRAIDT